MTSHLLAGESVIAVERQHVAVLVPAAAVAVVCLGVPLVLIQLVPGTVLGHGVGTAKAIADAVVAVVVAGWFLLRVLRWRCQTYTLTTHRIVLSRGVVSRVTEFDRPGPHPGHRGAPPAGGPPDQVGVGGDPVRRP